MHRLILGVILALQVWGSSTNAVNDHVFCGADTGSVNALACSNLAAAKITAYTVGWSYSVQVGNTNTGATTFSMDGLTAYPVKKLNGTADLASGDIVSGKIITLTFDASNVFELQSPVANVPSGTGGASSPATTALLKGNGSVNGITTAVAGSDYQQYAAEIPAKQLGFACDGTTDDSAKFSNASYANYSIRLPDNSTCLAANINFPTGVVFTGGTNTHIAHLPSDTTHYLINTGATGWALKSLTLDFNGVDIGSYTGSNIANTAITVASGGSGFNPNTAILMSFTGGGGSGLNAYAMTNGSGNVASVTLTQPGGGYTSAPSDNTNWTGTTACPGGGCTAPTFTIAAPNNAGAPTNYFGVYLNNAQGFLLQDVTLMSTGGTKANLAGMIGGILMYKGSGKLVRVTAQNTVAGAQFKHDSGATSGYMLFDHVSGDGSGYYMLQITSSNSSDPTANDEVSGGTCTNVYDALQGTSTGSSGNCYSIYNVSHVDIHDTVSLYPRYSGIRISGSRARFITAHDNQITGAGEASGWCELGAENVRFERNTITNFSTGISCTNLSQRPSGGRNVVAYNTLQGGTNFGIYADKDNVFGNLVVDVPIGFKVGYGGTGGSMTWALNTCRNSGLTTSTTYPITPMQICLSVDKGLTASGIRLYDNDVDGAGVISSIAINNPQLDVCGITAANPAVITLRNTPGTALAVGQTYLIGNVQTWQGNGSVNTSNMTQINGQLCTASAVTSNTITCGGTNTINSSAYTAWTANPQGNSHAAAFLVYSSGTTPQWTMPSGVTIR